MARVTKEELKENELIFYIKEIAEFFKKYWERLKVILLVVGVAVLFVVLVLLGNARTRASAAMELNSALAIYQNQQLSPQERYTKAIDAFKPVADRGAGGYARNEALLYMGNCYYFLGKYDEALEAFTKCSERVKKGILGIYAREGIAKVDEGRGNYTGALQIYQKILSENPKHFFRGNILLDAGRCYEKMGNVKDAAVTYQKILDSSPDSAWAREAKFRMNILNEQKQ